MIAIKPVTDYGQINNGDTLVLEKQNGVKFVATAREVLNPNTNNEEILLTKRSNDYFIMGLFLEGRSWVKNACVLIDVKVVTLTNNFNELKNVGEINRRS